MKAFRAIKIILLIVAIVCLLVSCAGNFFILKDACDNKIEVEEVHNALKTYEFKIGSIFKGKAEGESNGGVAAGDADTADNGTGEIAENATISQDTIQDTVVDTAEIIVGDTFEDTIEETASSYKAGDHIGIINGLMKAGNARISLSFLKDLKFDLGKAGTVGMRAAGDDEGGQPVFEINLWLAIAFVALTLSFIIHLFTKNRRKTLWGILLMIFGYLLFTAFFAAGNVLANLDINQLIKTEITDFAAYRIYVICGCTVIGCIMGLGFIRCGSRAMKRRKRKDMAHR